MSNDLVMMSMIFYTIKLCNDNRVVFVPISQVDSDEPRVSHFEL